MTDGYNSFVNSVESPNGQDNAMGSGAFGRYQFMPATAAAFAQRTAWGKGLTPEQVKAAVLADPRREDELQNLYTGDSRSALGRAGLPANNTSLLALHRFGQGGGVSLLQAPGQMPVAEWVKSVNWGPGVSAEAVIRQNRLDRYKDVDSLRSGFLGGGPVTASAGAPAPAQAPAAAPAPAPQPLAAAFAPQPVLAPPVLPVSELGTLFSAPQKTEDRRNDEARRRRQALFG